MAIRETELIKNCMGRSGRAFIPKGRASAKKNMKIYFTAFLYILKRHTMPKDTKKIKIFAEIDEETVVMSESIMFKNTIVLGSKIVRFFEV